MRITVLIVAVASLLSVMAAAQPSAPAQDAGAAPAVDAGAAASYKIAKRLAVGGAGGWDYVAFDAGSRRLYVAHDDRVEVLDAISGKVIGQVMKTEGVHGVAIAGEPGRGFASNGRAGTVSAFDLETLKVIREIPVGKKPDAIVYDPFTRRVFVFNGKSADATVIDAAGMKAAGTIPLGGAPEFAVADGRGRVFVNVEDTGELVAIDAKAMKVAARWPLKPCAEPTGLALDAAHRRLFSVCRNRLMAVTDADTGAQVATVPIGAVADGCVFDPDAGLAISSNGEGTLTVVKEESPSVFTVKATVPTQRGARTIALDPATHALYLPTAELGAAPPPTAENPKPRPPVLPGTFVILQMER